MAIKQYAFERNINLKVFYEETRLIKDSLSQLNSTDSSGLGNFVLKTVNGEQFSEFSVMNKNNSRSTTSIY